MSWDKNTVRTSALDASLGVLKDLGADYDLTLLADVRGRGLNDGEFQTYDIRRLEYKDVVILEHMVRTCDCDVDDVIESFRYTKGAEPENWMPEVNECVCGHCEDQGIVNSKEYDNEIYS